VRDGFGRRASNAANVAKTRPFFSAISAIQIFFVRENQAYLGER
jgi:hypothetical protein